MPGLTGFSLKAQLAGCFVEHFAKRDWHEFSDQERATAISAMAGTLILLAQKADDLPREAREQIAAIGVAGTAWTVEEVLNI